MYIIVCFLSCEIRKRKKMHVLDRATRRAYLVTYSQADREKFPTRQNFGECVENAFNSCAGVVTVSHWAYSLGQHAQGGEHYHVSAKLRGPRRWKAVRDFFAYRHGINVNFSDNHHNYYSAYRYVTKQDKSVCLIPVHPNLSRIGSPKTGKCIRAYREKSIKRKSTDNNSGDPSTSTASSGRISQLFNLDVSEFIVENRIRNTDELFAASKQWQQEGNKDLGNFLIGRCVKKLR